MDDARGVKAPRSEQDAQRTLRMSLSDTVKNLAAILAGRWQAPLALCALLLGGVTLYRLKPADRAVPFDALLADVVGLVEAGEYYEAANATANLLEYDPPFSDSERAILHETLADIIFRQESFRAIPNRKNTLLLLENHEAAAALGFRHGARGALRAGCAHEWLGNRTRAVNSLKACLSRDPAPDIRRAALQGLVRLLDGVKGVEEERRGYIEDLLAEEGVSQPYLWWALQKAIRDALDRDDSARATELVESYAPRFLRSDLQGYHDYLRAWVYVHAGDTDQAWPLVERVDEWLAQHGSAEMEMDAAGFLPALNTWLRGRIELAEARPQAALEHFDRALGLQSHGDLLLAAAIGQSEALGRLERHEAARECIRQAEARIANDASMLGIGRPRLRRAVIALADYTRAANNYAETLNHLKLAVDLAPEDEEGAARLDLLERFGSEAIRGADLAEDPDKARALHDQAAMALEDAAGLAPFGEPRHGSLLWAAAEEYDQAGRMADARRLLLAFVHGRSMDPRTPQALLRLGKAYAADGQFEDAVKYYDQLIADFPRLEEASRARLLTADCLTAMGSERYAEAEALLTGLLEDRYVSPKALVYRDALAALCDLLYQRHAHAAAISHMEDFLTFYPNDPEQFRIRFALADAYRASAYQIRDNQSEGSEVARREASRERFVRAAQLFEEFIETEDESTPDDDTAGVYERLALFYRGDCLFELNEPESLDEALSTYRQAAARYQGEPAALSAQVQIANVFLRQGKLIEAARAVERARWLLGGVPDRMFAEYGDGMGRIEWDRYLTTIRSSDLFTDVFVDAK